MKTLMLLPVLLSLSAFTCQERPQTVTQHVYCVTTDQYKKLVDAEPAKIGNSNPDINMLVTQNVLVRRYADGLLQVIGGCIGPVPQHAS